MEPESSAIWKARWLAVQSYVINFFWAAIIYLASELTIWGLSCLLARAHLEYFASISAMLLVMGAMGLVTWFSPEVGASVQQWFKPKVDFININLGIGFPIPIAKMNSNSMLGSHDIARVLGTVVVSNVGSWLGTFALGALAMWLIQTLRPSISAPTLFCTVPQRVQATFQSAAAIIRSIVDYYVGRINFNFNFRIKWGTGSASDQSSGSSLTAAPEPTSPSGGRTPIWNLLAEHYDSLMPLAGILVIGLPLAFLAKEERFLDAFVLCLMWVNAVRIQRLFKTSSLLSSAPRVKSVLATMMNPVLATTLFMLAYTRTKAASKGGNLSDVLATLSGGTPLYALWTALVTDTPLKANPRGWFGAGDAAMSLLECGIVVWGFKLHECRRQLFSPVGLAVSAVCIVAAAGNAFLSVLAARLIGLSPPEALAFAARCTTLALSKPAVTAVGGNLSLNAVVVVSNGILGQIMYPFVLDRIGVQRAATASPVPRGDLTDASHDKVREARGAVEERRAENDNIDSIVTVAAGVAVGINGAAMGVSYLYETKSRAAPYAVLSMVIFGAMTVIFTTVDPFKTFLLRVCMG